MYGLVQDLPRPLALALTRAWLPARPAETVAASRAAVVTLVDFLGLCAIASVPQVSAREQALRGWLGTDLAGRWQRLPALLRGWSTRDVAGRAGATLLVHPGGAFLPALEPLIEMAAQRPRRGLAPRRWQLELDLAGRALSRAWSALLVDARSQLDLLQGISIRPQGRNPWRARGLLLLEGERWLRLDPLLARTKSSGGIALASGIGGAAFLRFRPQPGLDEARRGEVDGPALVGTARRFGARGSTAAPTTAWEKGRPWLVGAGVAAVGALAAVAAAASLDRGTRRSRRSVGPAEPDRAAPPEQAGTPGGRAQAASQPVRNAAGGRDPSGLGVGELAVGAAALGAMAVGGFLAGRVSRPVVADIEEEQADPAQLVETPPPPPSGQPLEFPREAVDRLIGLLRWKLDADAQRDLLARAAERLPQTSDDALWREAVRTRGPHVLLRTCVDEETLQSLAEDAQGGPALDVVDRAVLALGFPLARPWIDRLSWLVSCADAHQQARREEACVGVLAQALTLNEQVLHGLLHYYSRFLLRGEAAAWLARIDERPLARWTMGRYLAGLKKLDAELHRNAGLRASFGGLFERNSLLDVRIDALPLATFRNEFIHRNPKPDRKLISALSGFTELLRTQRHPTMVWLERVVEDGVWIRTPDGRSRSVVWQGGQPAGVGHHLYAGSQTRGFLAPVPQV